jgi:hypothetical protein
VPASYFQLPADGPGKLVRTRTRVENALTVHEQYVALGGEPAWTIFTTPATLAQNKHFLSMLNAVGSGQVIKLRKLYLINMQTVAVTGVAVQFDLKKITAITAGTANPPVIHDSTDTALANFTCVAAPTAVTEGSLLFSVPTTNEENPLGATGTMATQSWQQQQTNLIMEDLEGKEYEMNPGEGITVKMITATTVGSYSVMAEIARAL